MFNLLYSDNVGHVFDDPYIEALGFNGIGFCECFEKDMIPLPRGALLNLMPGRAPLGRYENKIKDFKHLGSIKNPSSVSAILPNGYTRLLLPAYKTKKYAPNLPLFAYSAVGFKSGMFYVSAHNTDTSVKWDSVNYNTSNLPLKIEKRLKEEPRNQLLRHLSFCALNYQCFNAQNIFFRRWEGGIPLSSHCNSHCLGCISYQNKKKTGFPSPQKRIKFTPLLEDILSIGLEHLNKAPEAILSFGQGCEGEPTLKPDLLINAIEKLRHMTDSGIIHLNTNGGYPEVLEKLFNSGLDSIRISFNSAIQTNFQAYFRPNFDFSTVRESINRAYNYPVFTSLNLLVMPGFSDREEEVESLFDFLKKNPVNMIQLRNLNFDPGLYFSLMPKAGGKVIGMMNFINLLKQNFPDIRIGSVNPYIKNIL